MACGLSAGLHIFGLFIFQRNTQDRDGGRESPRPTAEAAPAPPEAAAAGPPPAAAAQELTKDKMKKKSVSILEEYLNIRDVKVG